MPSDETVTAESWRQLPFHAGSTSLHFALSDALVRHTPEPTVWWHEATRPTLILGNGQRHVSSEVDGSADVEIVRRQSGGTAVFATSGVLGLDLALPVGHPLARADIVEAYRWLGEVWVDATHALGVESRIISIAEARDRTRRGTELHALQLACFGSFSPYEVAVGSRKLVGLAQVRRLSGVLLQSAIHLRFDATTLARLVDPESAEKLASALLAAAAGLHDVAPDEPSIEDVMEAFRASLFRLIGVQLRLGDWTPAEIRHAMEHQPVLDPNGNLS